MHGLMFTLEHNLNVIVEIIHRRHTVHHVNVHCTQLPELMKLQYFFKVGLVILLGVEKFDSWGVFHVRVYRPQQTVDTSYTYSTRCAGNQVASAANTDYIRNCTSASCSRSQSVNVEMLRTTATVRALLCLVLLFAWSGCHAVTQQTNGWVRVHTGIHVLAAKHVSCMQLHYDIWYRITTAPYMY